MGAGLVSVLFPPFCIFCGFLGRHICGKCVVAQVKQENHCHYCGKKSQHGVTHFGCGRSNGIDGCLHLFTYRSHVIEALHRAKYNDEWALLGDLLFHATHNTLREMLWWNRLCSPLLCPVPLYREKELSRGYNQAKLICGALALLTGIGVVNPLVRLKNTPPLAQIHAIGNRAKAVRGAFGLTEDVAGRSVMIVDDIVTSGSTVRECAKVLKEGGARFVLAVSIAKG